MVLTVNKNSFVLKKKKRQNENGTWIISYTVAVIHFPYIILLYLSFPGQSLPNHYYSRPL